MTDDLCPGQVDLFDLLSDPAAPGGSLHAVPTDTEAHAAALVAPRAGTQRLRVLAAIADAGDSGLTDPELAATTGLYLYSAAPRRNELLNGGWLEDSGLRRSTGRGGGAIAWRLSPAGRHHVGAVLREASA